MENRNLSILIKKRARHIKMVAFLLSFAPFVRGVILTGSATHAGFNQNSDIDLMIVGKTHRLYLARFSATLALSLTGLRRTKNTINSTGLFCLNYLLTENFPYIPFNRSRNIDLICARAYLNSIFLWSENNFKSNYQIENYPWMRSFLRKEKIKINFSDSPFNHIKFRRTKFSKLIQFILEFPLKGKIGDKIEKCSMNFQTSRILSDPVALKYPDLIAANHYEIRLHPPKTETKFQK